MAAIVMGLLIVALLVGYGILFHRSIVVTRSQRVPTVRDWGLLPGGSRAWDL